MKLVLYFILIIRLQQPTIGREQVAADLKKAQVGLPDYVIDNGEVKIFYINNFGLAHLRYKEFLAPFVPMSYIAIYKLEGRDWSFSHAIPFTAEIELIDRGQMLFLSNNENCSMLGECYQYSVVTQFDGNQMTEIVSYGGFDHTVNYDVRINVNREEVTDLVGDTIANRAVIVRPHIDKNNLIFDLERETTVLLGADNDSLTVNSKRWFISNIRVKLK